jgi:hypothetical protein
MSGNPYLSRACWFSPVHTQGGLQGDRVDDRGRSRMSEDERRMNRGWAEDEREMIGRSSADDLRDHPGPMHPDSVRI